MYVLLFNWHLKLNELISRSEGQDMVEYALVLGMLCFGVTSASKFLAAGIAQAFLGISSTMGSYIS